MTRRSNSSHSMPPRRPGTTTPFWPRAKSQDEALAEVGVSKADLMKAQIFFVKDKFIARAWGGYASTKATGNEVGK